MMAMGYFASSTTTKRKIKKFAESDTEKWKSGRATFWRRRRWRKWKNPIFNELNFFGNTEAEWENIVKDRDADRSRNIGKIKNEKVLVSSEMNPRKFAFCSHWGVDGGLQSGKLGLKQEKWVFRFFVSAFCGQSKIWMSSNYPFCTTNFFWKHFQRKGTTEALF